MSKQSTTQGYPDASKYVDGNIDPAFSRDPFEPLAKLRAKGAVVRQGKAGLFQGWRFPDNFMFAAAQRPIYLALSFDAARKVASDAKNFSNELAYGPTLGRTFGETLMSMDGARHATMKKLVLPSFGHRSVNEDLIGMAAPIVDSTLDQIVDRGEAELISEFTAIFPFLIVAQMFGVPNHLAKEAEDLVLAATAMAEDIPKGIAALRSMDELYQTVVDDHRVNPRDDMVDALLNTEVEGVRLTDSEIVSFIKQIVAAGLDTTVRQTANLIYLLLENPDQFDLLKSEPSLLENAIFEGMRVESAGGFSPRVAINDVEVEGVDIPRGAGVYAVIHSANRDSDRWENPNKFDITRPRKQFMTLGAGPHACLGANLTIAEQKIAMTSVLTRLKNLRKDPQRWGDTQIRGFQLRSATKLPVLWDA
jgi:cytochrome P450